MSNEHQTPRLSPRPPASAAASPIRAEWERPAMPAPAANPTPTPRPRPTTPPAPPPTTPTITSRPTSSRRLREPAPPPAPSAAAPSAPPPVEWATDESRLLKQAVIAAAALAGVGIVVGAVAAICLRPSRRPLAVASRAVASVPVPPAAVPVPLPPFRSVPFRPVAKPAAPTVAKPPRPFAPFKPAPAIRAATTAPERPAPRRERPILPRDKATCEASFEALLTSPARFADKLVVTEGFLAIRTELTRNPDGTLWATMAPATLRFTSFWQTLYQAETPQSVPIERDLARKLTADGTFFDRRSGSSILGNRWFPLAAIASFQVFNPDPAHPTRWVPMLVRLEFLASIDPFKLGRSNYKKAVWTFDLDADVPTADRVHLNERTGWSTRLDPAFLKQVKSVVKTARRQQADLGLDVLNTAITRSLSAAMAAAQSQELELRRLYLNPMRR